MLPHYHSSRSTETDYAYYSEAREGQNVPVDVTPVRFLRKPNGAKPGMVVYDRYRTVLVTPDAALPARLRVE